MSINNIAQTGGTANVSKTLANQATKPKTTTKPNTTTSTANKDNVYLSEAAKDLAAKQAGKGAQEEATESMTSRLKEQAAGMKD